MSKCSVTRMKFRRKTGVSAVMILPEEMDPRISTIECIEDQCDELVIVKGGSRGFARNKGLEQAMNRYVLMVDSDQLLSKDYVQDLLAEGGDFAVASGLVLPHFSLSCLSKLEEYFKAAVSLNIKAIGAGGNLYERDLALRAGGFRSDGGKLYDGDYELLQKLQASYGAKFVPTAMIFHLKEYTIEELVKAGLTSATSRNVPLRVLFRRLFTTPMVVLQKLRALHSLSSDTIAYSVVFYSFFRGFVTFICAFVGRILR